MSGNEVSAVHRALNNLFTTLSPEQVQKFLSEMNGESNAPSGVAAVAASNASIMSTTPNNLLIVNKSVTSTAMETPVVTRRTSRGKRVRENGKLRPLNSFIAFRSFYSAAFPDLSQEVKSGLLRLLWGSDPFKGKWAILAKAYSNIRDKHSDQVTLESFLALNGPFIGIVPAAEYLGIMGLQLVQGPDKQFSLVKTNNKVILNPVDLTTNLSADDIIDYCYKTGYVHGAVPGKNSAHQEAALTMAVSAQPNDPAKTGSETGNVYQSLTTYETTISPDMDVESPPNNDAAMAADAPQSNALVVRVPPLHPAVINNAATIAQHFGNNVNTVNNGPYTAADFDQELRDVMNAFPFDPEDDGYYGLFNPALRTPVLVYNPYRIQSDFDAFDIGEFSNM